LLGIGEMAQLSGLTVSALRFYDGAGVLTPAQVDERTGYRRYARGQVDTARLIARLRRVRMPLPEICRLLASRTSPDAALAIVEAHLRRLEAGLDDARRELSTVRSLIEQWESAVPAHPTTTVTVTGAALASSLRAVRYATGADPEFPSLAGVLIEVDTGTGEVRFVATDRFRLAMSTLAGRAPSGPVRQSIAPTPFVDDVIAGLGETRGEPTLALDGDRITVTTTTGELTADRLDHDFPDYRRLIRPTADPRYVVDAAELGDRLRTAPTVAITREQDGMAVSVAALRLGDHLDVADPGDPDAVGFDREFLLQALDAGGPGQLTLRLDGPIGPLAIGEPDHPGTFSLVMATRLR
jgi:DNA-binding transcriptional MerR regulator